MQVATVTTSDAVTLQVETMGEGAPILFVAGYCASAASWTWQVEAVVAAGYRAVTIDRRWHGLSDRPRHGHRIARHAADVRAVIAALALERPLLVGASMGASVCWSYLDLFGSDNVAGMIAIDQTPCMVNQGDWRNGYYGLTKDNLGTFFDQGIPPTGRGGDPLKRADTIAQLQAQVGSEPLVATPTADTQPLLDDHARQDWRDVCRRSSAPMLLIAARDSQLWPCEHAAAAADGSAAAGSLIIDDCGHAMQFEGAVSLTRTRLCTMHVGL